MNQFLAIIDASYANEQLYPLTSKRCTGSIPILSKFRTIDFTISALVSAEVDNIAIFPGKKMSSLNYHLRNGAPWHLDIAKNGLHIFDVDSYSIEPVVSYHVMRNNPSFLMRSYQEYAILAHSNAIHNINFDDVKAKHVESGADITIIKKDGKNTNFYILSTELLNTFIDESIKKYETSIIDTLKNRQNLTINEINTTDMYIEFNNVIDYYNVSMDILGDFKKQKAIGEFFSGGGFVKTSKNHSTPTKIVDDAKIKRALIGNGCFVAGKIKHSIVFRNVTVGKNTKIENSIIMDGAIIGESCVIKNAIIEKHTKISNNTVVMGEKELPSIILRNEVV